jgi:methylenetetrahydrofolate dehydrogenase (NADP+) / methenyltetrahydrofolate cyclohydrolase
MRDTDGALHGDYEVDEIENIASFYTPTPGGVGPVNVASLMQNVIEACILQTQ